MSDTTPSDSLVRSRADFAIIGKIIEPRSRVLDLGCGEGELLAWLAENKNVRARGVEISPSMVRVAIARGVMAHQADIDESLADYPDQAFDYVILSQTLQETRDPLQVLRQMLRVGKRGIVSFPNFAHWTARIAHLASGRAPRTRHFPYDWHESPNLHYLTVRDFEETATKLGFRIEQRHFLAGDRQVHFAPNLLAEVAVYLVAG